MFEQKGITNAFLRTAFLVNSQWWNTLILNLLAIIIIWTGGVIFSIPNMITGADIDVFGAAKIDIEQLPLSYWILSGFSTVVSSLLWVIVYTFWAFQYFNLNERMKEKYPPTV